MTFPKNSWSKIPIDCVYIIDNENDASLNILHRSKFLQILGCVDIINASKVTWILRPNNKRQNGAYHRPVSVALALNVSTFLSIPFRT